MGCVREGSLKRPLELRGNWPQYSPNASTLIRLGFDNRTGTNLGLGNEYDTGCTISSNSSANGTATTSPTPLPVATGGAMTLSASSLLIMAFTLLVGLFLF